MKSYKEKFYEKVHIKQEPEVCEDCGHNSFSHWKFPLGSGKVGKCRVRENKKDCECKKFKAPQNHSPEDDRLILAKRSHKSSGNTFNLSEKAKEWFCAQAELDVKEAVRRLKEKGYLTLIDGKYCWVINADKFDKIMGPKLSRGRN